MHPGSVPVDVSWNETMGALNVTHNPLPYLGAVLLVFVVLSSYGYSQKKLVVLNEKSPWELTSTRAKKKIVSGAQQMIDNWFKKNPRKPVQVIADLGAVTVLPAHMAEEIRNSDQLSFSRWVSNVGFVDTV